MKDMPMTSKSKLHVSQGLYEVLIENLANNVLGAYQPNVVIALSRGGLRPGDILSRALKVPLAVMAIKSYTADNQQGAMTIGPITFAHATELAGKVLIVDDLLDSGETMKAAVETVRKSHARVTEIKTAVLWKKPSCPFDADFCVEVLTTDKWIVQPFEKYGD